MSSVNLAEYLCQTSCFEISAIKLCISRQRYNESLGEGFGSLDLYFCNFIPQMLTFSDHQSSGNSLKIHHIQLIKLHNLHPTDWKDLSPAQQPNGVKAHKSLFFTRRSQIGILSVQRAASSLQEFKRQPRDGSRGLKTMS